MEDTFTLFNYRRCPFCIRVRLVLLYKEIPFDIKEEQLGKWSGEFLSLRAYKPCVPVLVHNKFGIYESHIIMEYLEDLYPDKHPLSPTDPTQKAKQRLWFFWSSGQLRDWVQLYKYGKNTDEINEGVLNVSKCFMRLERELADKPFLLGDSITLADLAVWPFVRQALRVTPQKVSLPKRVQKWYETIETHPKLTTVMDKPPKEA